MTEDAIGFWPPFMRTAVLAVQACLMMVIGYVANDAFVAPSYDLSIRMISATPDLVTYEVAGIRRRTCAKTEVSRFIVQRNKDNNQRNDGMYLAFRDAAQAYNWKVGAFRIKDDIHIDPPLAPGHYFLEVRIISFCGAIVRADSYPILEMEIK